MLNKSFVRRRLQATGFLGFLDPQKHSAATQPVQEAVAASPTESSQRMLTHRTVTEFGRVLAKHPNRCYLIADSACYTSIPPQREYSYT